MSKHYILMDIINKCNKSCSYCVMAKWRNNEDYPDTLTYEQITEFIGTYMKDDNTFPELYVEITGGEPTLFEDLHDVIEMLTQAGAKILLRTNGINLEAWRRDYPNMLVILAKHDESDEYINQRRPFLLQHDIIQTGAGLGKWQSPEAKFFEYCRDNKNQDLQHEFKNIIFLTNGSKCKSCPGDPFDIEYPMRADVAHDACPSCPYCLTAWDLFANYLPK
jgi:organic radical activating enzyme